MAICRKCTAEYSNARYNLGYRVCLPCGEVLAKGKTFCVVPAYNKGAYMVVRDPALLVGIHRKGG